MVEAVRSFDWATTPLGPLGQWPACLRTAVDICLHSRFPTFVWWGPELINVYNDAYIPILGRRHATALGRPARELWAEVWSHIEPQIDVVFSRGEASWEECAPLTVERNGFTEVAHFSWSHSPIHDEAGRVGGVICVVREDTERVRADESRRMTEARFQRLVDHSPQSTQLMHPDGRPRQVNRAFERLFGITMEQLHDYNMLHDPGLERAGALPLMRRAFAGEPVTIPPIPYVMDRGEHAGQTRWTGATVYPVKDDAGRVEEVVLVHHDVTDQRRAEQALRESEERFRLMANAVPQILWVTDAEGRVQFFNQQWYVYTGASDQATSAAEVSQTHVHPDDGQVTMAAFDAARRTGTTFHVEHRIRAASGEYRWFLVRGEPYRDPGTGEVTRWFGASMDIHDRRQAEESLRAQSLVTETVTRNAAEALYMLDADGAVTYANQAAEAMFGWARDEMIGRRLHDLVHFVRPDGRPFPMAECPISQCFATGRTLRNHEDVFVRRDGSFLPVLCSMTPIHDGERDRSAVLAVMDIADRKRAEQDRQLLLEAEQRARSEAERAGRMKDEFLATLSHELRTPLSAILGWSHILGRGGAKPETLAEGLATIERNARAQTQIIDDLLDMSRIVSGKISLDARRVDLATVVRAAIETVRASAAAKGVEIVVDASAEDRGAILGDLTRLQQVFWNLLANAVKFTPRGGVVRVTIARRDGDWQVEVADSGEGIAADFLPFVFDRFRQADASTTRRHGGLGLGLSIVKQLVELHGGKVRVRSEGRGRGATFTVSLPPIADDDLPARPRHDAGADAGVARATSTSVREGVRWDASVAGSLRGVSVLIVDDEPDARALLRRLLEDCGCTALVAETADEAVASIERHRPDVLVSDIGMPGEDGYALLSRVRALGPGRGGATPAIALTAYARAEDRVKAVRAGFRMHVPKPVEPAELVAMIESLVGKGG